MIEILAYESRYQIDIDAMIDEIACEFDSSISNPNTSRPSVFDKYWVAFNKTEIIGTVAVLRIDNNACILKNMFVKKNYRGKKVGVSGWLLRKVFDWGTIEDVNCIYLGTMDQFKAAHKFYEKNGFQKVALHELPTGFINNPIDNVFYKKALNQNK